MLDDISLYWFTDTAASSARIYWENTRAGMAGASGGRIELPMAASVFPHEIFVRQKPGLRHCGQTFSTGTS